MQPRVSRFISCLHIRTVDSELCTIWILCSSQNKWQNTGNNKDILVHVYLNIISRHFAFWLLEVTIEDSCVIELVACVCIDTSFETKIYYSRSGNGNTFNILILNILLMSVYVQCSCSCRTDEQMKVSRESLAALKQFPADKWISGRIKVFVRCALEIIAVEWRCRASALSLDRI